MEKAIDNALINLTAFISGGRDTFLFYWLHDWWEEGADPRIKGYTLVDVSGPMIGFIMLTYMNLVLFIIPLYMKNRKPYNLKNIMLAYDLLLVVINAYFFFYALSHVRDMWDFRNPKTDTSEKAYKFINTAYLYYLSKLIDLFDTIFMALKKKNSHITVLHVWHHVSVPSAGWMYMKYNPYMPTEYMFPLLNGFVHVVMYGYYGLAALGPHMQKYLWWKKYITRMQIIQMTIAFVWFNLVLYKSTDISPLYHACNIGNAAALLILFLNFYIQAYRKGRKHHVKAN